MVNDNVPKKCNRIRSIIRTACCCDYVITVSKTYGRVQGHPKDCMGSYETIWDQFGLTNHGELKMSTFLHVAGTPRFQHTYEHSPKHSPENFYLWLQHAHIKLEQHNFASNSARSPCVICFFQHEHVLIFTSFHLIILSTSELGTIAPSSS